MKIRILQLGIKQADIIRMLGNKGIIVEQADVSRAVNCSPQPRFAKIREEIDKIHNSNNIAMPSASMEGKVIGVTIHNTDWITTAEGTTPAEQYTRATKKEK